MHYLDPLQRYVTPCNAATLENHVPLASVGYRLSRGPVAGHLEFTMIVPSLLRSRSTRSLPSPANRLESERESLHKLMREHAKGLLETLQDTADAASNLCETDCA